MLENEGQGYLGGKGPLSKPTAAAQPRPQERVLMPHSRRHTGPKTGGVGWEIVVELRHIRVADSQIKSLMTPPFRGAIESADRSLHNYFEQFTMPLRWWNFTGNLSR